MKCRIMALAVAFAGLITASASANDELIAQQIIQRMQQHKQQAQLRDFNIGVQVEQGTVTVMGTVAQADHAVLALDVARRVPGVKLVVNDLFVQPQGQTTVTSKSETVNAPTTGNFAGFVNQDSGGVAQSQMQTAQDQQFQMQQAQLAQMQQVQLQPQPQVQQAQLQVASPAEPVPTQAPAVNQTPVPFARANGGVTRPVSYQAPEYGQASPAQYASGGPAPVPMNGGSMGTASYDNPQMPGYAWPSYASYPNYAAASYPQQYSPTAWPYIGPFYPYPQVPLGWRKVTLEWDDGWWFLDFNSK